MQACRGVTNSLSVQAIILSFLRADDWAAMVSRIFLEQKVSSLKHSNPLSPNPFTPRHFNIQTRSPETPEPNSQPPVHQGLVEGAD